MQISPSRDINSSVRSATGVSTATGFELQTVLHGGTMTALCKLMQSGRPHGQNKEDPDRQGRKNGQNPICKSDHGYLPGLRNCVLPH
jgi:hypothetical protein